MYSRIISQIPKIIIISLLLTGTTLINAQDKNEGLDTVRFYDSAHHWYDINDEQRVINPLPGQLQYKKSEIRKIADNILLYQKNNGGWAKNFDMQAMLTDEQRQALIENKTLLNTTFDNGTTHSQLTYLAQVYTITEEDKYKEGFLKGIQFVLDAQYDNGGWPQFYPDTSGYRKYITFNDNAMTGVMVLLQQIVHGYPEYDFINDDLRNKLEESYANGIDAILKCQIIDNGIKTAWCQQHDNVTFVPQHARIYEKPSICNNESAEITKLLMNIENPNEDIIDAVESAVKWFKDSEIHGLRVDIIEATEEKFAFHTSKHDKIVVEDDDAPRIWARFYELGTHKPIFSGRDGEVKYSLEEIDRDRRTGYGWYTYAPEEIYGLYSEWSSKWTPGKNILDD